MSRSGNSHRIEVPQKEAAAKQNEQRSLGQRLEAPQWPAGEEEAALKSTDAPVAVRVSPALLR